MWIIMYEKQRTFHNLWVHIKVNLTKIMKLHHSFAAASEIYSPWAIVRRCLCDPTFSRFRYNTGVWRTDNRTHDDSRKRSVARQKRELAEYLPMRWGRRCEVGMSWRRTWRWRWSGEEWTWVEDDSVVWASPQRTCWTSYYKWTPVHNDNRP